MVRAMGLSFQKITNKLFIPKELYPLIIWKSLTEGDPLTCPALQLSG
jgi:hypothetical protein